MLNIEYNPKVMRQRRYFEGIGYNLYTVWMEAKINDRMWNTQENIGDSNCALQENTATLHPIGRKSPFKRYMKTCMYVQGKSLAIFIGIIHDELAVSYSAQLNIF